MNDNTEVIPLDADTLEVRYYDAGRPGTYRCWKIPLHEARDIARWWAETGSRVGADRPPRDAQRVGSILVSFLSGNQVYALGCDERGWSKYHGLPVAAGCRRLSRCLARPRNGRRRWDGGKRRNVATSKRGPIH